MIKSLFIPSSVRSLHNYIPHRLHRFFLLPALLGDLTMNGVEGENRLDNIEKARIYFVDYLQRSKSYSITTEVCNVRVCVC